MATYLGDFRLNKIIRKLFNTNAAAGESITIATNGTISVYKDGGLTQTTTGVTFTEDFDGLVGVHLIAVDTSSDGTFYSAGSDFEVVLSGATIDGKSVNATLFSFSLENRSALMPTTAGLKLNVEVDGMAHADLKEWLGTAPLILTAQQVQSVVPNTQKVDVETIKTRAVSAAGAIVVGGFVGQDTAAIGVNVTGHISRVVLVDTSTALSPAERTAIANEVESQIIDETDSEKVLNAITDKIASVNPSLGGLTVAAIASAVWNNGVRILTAGTNIILAKGVGVTGFNDLSAAQVNTEVDAALLDVGLTLEVTGRMDLAISTRLATGDYTLPLDAAGIRLAVGLAAANLDDQFGEADDATIEAIIALGSGIVSAVATQITTDHGEGSYVRNTEPNNPVVPTTAEIADKVLIRSLAGGADGGRTVQDALRFLRNRWTRTATDLTVYEEDDTTVAWVSALTSLSTNPPVTESNPA